MKFKLLISAILLSVIAGCASSGHKLDQDQMAQIKKGVTTKEQALAVLGQPNSITDDGKGNTIFVYAFAHSKVSGKSWIPVYGAFAGGTETNYEAFAVTFNSQGVVMDTTFTQGNTESHR